VIAAVGLRFPGEKLQEVLDELKKHLQAQAPPMAEQAGPERGARLTA
jgi:hypothetical protein